jgi:TolB protein
MARGCLLVAVIVALIAPAATDAAYPGANGRIAFENQRTDGSHDLEIFSANPDGSDVRQLTHNFGDDRAPSWSPDGTKIAFSSLRAGKTGIWVMNADGSDQHVVTESADQFYFAPTWSPDGTRIAFRATAEIYVVNVDGTGLTNLTNNPAPDYDPAWSPTGDLIAFFSQRDHFDEEIYVMNPNGSGQRNVTNSPGTVDHTPEWAPDGSKILFYRDAVLHTIRPDGTGLIEITPGIVPAFAPDGTKIAFVRRDQTGADIWVANADGSGAHVAIDHDTFDYNPDWQPLPNRPPDCSRVRAVPDSLGAPNHRLVPVTVSGAVDPDGDLVTIRITGVTQDEPVDQPDAVATAFPDRVQLRAERDPHGDGRVYRIAFAADDGHGGTCTGIATASVRKGNKAVDSAPPSYDSFGP